MNRMTIVFAAVLAHFHAAAEDYAITFHAQRQPMRGTRARRH
jgi:hypothetical protein